MSYSAIMAPKKSSIICGTSWFVQFMGSMQFTLELMYRAQIPSLYKAKELYFETRVGHRSIFLMSNALGSNIVPRKKPLITHAPCIKRGSARIMGSAQVTCRSECKAPTPLWRGPEAFSWYHGWAQSIFIFLWHNQQSALLLDDRSLLMAFMHLSLNFSIPTTKAGPSNNQLSRLSLKHLHFLQGKINNLHSFLDISRFLMGLCSCPTLSALQPIRQVPLITN